MACALVWELGDLGFYFCLQFKGKAFKKRLSHDQALSERAAQC